MIEIELEPHVSEATLARFASALSVRLTERTRRQLEDVRLTQLKEAAENRIPTLRKYLYRICFCNANIANNSNMKMNATVDDLTTF